MDKERTNILTFLKKNAVYLVLAFCILAVGLTVMLVLISENNKVIPSAEVDTPYANEPLDPKPVEPVIVNPSEEETEIVFCMPVISPSSIAEYSESMVFNSTLKRYSAHTATDFYAEEGANVYSAFDGTVESVENTLLTGYTITIDHGNGLKTVYNSLLDGDKVTVGQKVNKGQIIGQVSNTNRQEYKEGAHLHFEVLENGKSVNPSAYLDFETK